MAYLKHISTVLLAVMILVPVASAHAMPPPPRPACVLTASKLQAAPGEPVTLTWHTTDTDKALWLKFRGDMIDFNQNLPLQGSEVIRLPVYGKTVTLLVYNRYGNSSCQVYIAQAPEHKLPELKVPRIDPFPGKNKI